MITDPISDMLTRIRNASLVHHAKVELPYSKVKLAVAKILAQEGFLGGVEVAGEGISRALVLSLRYQGKMPVISSLKRVSKPGCRRYMKADELKRVHSGYGLAIVSTSQGIMTDNEARSRRLGGEVLCEVF